MNRRPNLRTLLLALAYWTGLVGMMVSDSQWWIAFLAMAILPPLIGIASAAAGIFGRSQDR